MKAPQFWHKRNFVSYLALSLSPFYLLGHLLNNYFKKPFKSTQPVVCIGNFVAGGAGKTPVAIAIGLILKDLNINFSYLSSGYSGKIKDFTLVRKGIDSAKNVGDEPLLLAEIADTFVCKDRSLGAKLIGKIPEKKLIIIDDGLQNNSLTKDFSIVVIDGNYGFGNGFTIPAGPLREPIFLGIKKADLIIIIGKDQFQIAKKFSNKKVISAKIVPINQEKFTKDPFIAFCGIGRPEKFFNSLREGKVNVVDELSFPDHYQFQKSDISRMVDLAKKNNCKLITTKKDWVRLDQSVQDQIEYFDIKIEFEKIDFIKEKLLELTGLVQTQINKN